MSSGLASRTLSNAGSGRIARTQEYQVYKSSSHNAAVMSGLNDLRHDGVLCDVTLLAEDQSFPAHKNVLSACSPYLRNLFNVDGSKTEHEVVEIRGVSAEGLKHVINFVYTSELELTMGNIQCVLAAAGHMQLKPIINFCKTFLISEISVYNCVNIIHIGEHYELRGVEDKAYAFIAEHLNELVKTEELQKLSLNNMSVLLDSYTLKNVSELELFEAARQWLLFDTDRYKHVRALMEKIHFPLIPPRDLLRYVNFVDFMRLECNYLLLEASNYHMLPHSQPILQSVRTQVRSTDTRMVIVGGVDQHDRVSNQLLAINENMTKSEFLPSMHEGICSHSVAVLNNFLYVVGGQNVFDERGTTAVNTVIRYDPRFNIWMRIASMNDKRAGFTVSVVENRLYALGGVNATGRLSSMECYSLEDDRWRYVASVQTGLCDHAQTVYGNLIYISGGFKEGRFSNQLLAYSPRHDTWHERSPMHYARGWHAMATYNDSIFVTGGNSGLSKRVDIHETEIYNGMSDQWTLMAPLPLPQSEGGCVVYESKVFVIGGYSWAQQKCLDTIQCYDMEKDEWESHGQLPIELSGVRLASLTVPYTVSPKTGLASSVSLSWPPKQVPSRFMDQDPRMMMMPGVPGMMSGTPSMVSGGMPGNMPLMQGPPGMIGVQGMMSGGYPPQSGPFAMNPYMDPMMMKDMREAMAEIQAGNRMQPVPQGIPRNQSQVSSHVSSKDPGASVSQNIPPSDAGQRLGEEEEEPIYSRPRNASLDDTSSLGSRGRFGKINDSEDVSSVKKAPSVKSASFKEPVEEWKKSDGSESSSSSSDEERSIKLEAPTSEVPSSDPIENEVNEPETNNESDEEHEPIRAYR